MKSKTRRMIILLVIFIICILFLFLNNIHTETHYQDAYYTYIEKGYSETNAQNLVAAIYLNYRVFDTLFEALLLAISVTAIVYFAQPWEKKNGS